MRSKMRMQYYCDFCKKSGASKHAMTLHEKHCTLNPERECRMCAIVEGGNGHDIPTLLELLPRPEDYKKMVGKPDGWDLAWNGTPHLEYPGLNEALIKALPLLRATTNNCPACILAVLRQFFEPLSKPYGALGNMTDGKDGRLFDYKKEAKSLFIDYNEDCGGGP